MKRHLYTLLLKCYVGSQDSSCCGQDLGSDPNGPLTYIYHIQMVLQLTKWSKTIC